MSSDPFVLLELDRASATDADVRRAYAAKLKATRPEDDRAGFMALRAAFERARDEVRWRDEYADYEQDHSPPDEYGQSTAHLMVEAPEAAVLPPVAPEEDAGISWTPAEAGVEPEAEALPGPEPVPEPDETDADAAEVQFEDRIGRALDRLIDTLTATGRAPPVRAVMEIVDGADVAGIEEYQSMQWQVRQFLCDRTGYNLDPQVLHIPDWLSLEVFDALDQYYGWTRQPVTQSWIRKLNDWTARVRKRIIWEALPKDEKAKLRSTALEKQGLIPDGDGLGKTRWDTPAGSNGGSQIWLWIGAGILISQVVRFLAALGGG